MLNYKTVTDETTPKLQQNEQTELLEPKSQRYIKITRDVRTGYNNAGNVRIA